MSNIQSGGHNQHSSTPSPNETLHHSHSVMPNHLAWAIVIYAEEFFCRGLKSKRSDIERGGHKMNSLTPPLP